MRLFGFLFVLLLALSCSAQKLRTLHFGMHASTDWGLYNDSYRLRWGHDWYKEQKWGIKKSVYLVHGKTSLYTDYNGDPNFDVHNLNKEEIHWGLQSLFSVYHRSEKHKFELGAGFGPGFYLNTPKTAGSQGSRELRISGEFQWYISTGRMFEKWGAQLQSGIIYASEHMQGYDIGCTFFFYH